MEPRKNVTAARRKGDHYQEWWGVKLCAEWLLDPDLFQWIKFEAVPEENDTNDFYLDDILVLKKEGFYNLYQTKHKIDPSNEWTWKELIGTTKKQKKSLIKKWATSLYKNLENPQYDFVNKVDETSFVTNAPPEQEIRDYLIEQQIDIKKIKTENPSLHTSLIDEIGSEDLATKFFAKFKFRFSEPSIDELAKELRKYYYTELCVTESGFNKYISWIRSKAEERVTTKILHEEIKKHCEFDVPRPLNEDFLIPDDFQLFNSEIHSSLVEDLEKVSGGIKVVFGNPGVGKSVYLSNLDKELGKKGIISIKHHYHISPEDDDPQERVNAKRINEAIKAEFKQHADKLGKLAHINSRGLPLSKYIKKLAAESAKENQSFVIIIDGLDHALKQNAEKELEELLKDICHPQKGVWIVLGMQFVAKPYLPPVVTQKFPEEEWIKVPGLSKKSVSDIVIHHNNISLKLPDDQQQKRFLANEIYNLTQGNPLHLRYVLRQLKNINGNTLVTSYGCQDLSPYGDSIEDYYKSVWSVISKEAKLLLFTMVSVNFRFTEDQLVECVSQFFTDPSKVTSGFNQIAHLVFLNFRNQLSVYHNSFEIYVKNLQEFRQQRIGVRETVKKWLDSLNDEYIKWAELKLIEHDLGNDEPLLSIDRKWLIDAICRPSNPSQISSQLSSSSKVALETGDFSKALKLSYLNTYYENASELSELGGEEIWTESLYLNPNIFDYLNFSELPVGAFFDLVLIADSIGKVEAIEALIDELRNRLEYQEYRQGEIPKACKAILKIIPFDRTHDLKKIYKYVVQFRDLDVTPMLFGTYLRSLLKTSQYKKVRDLFLFDLNDDEKEKIIDVCTEHAIKENVSELDDLLEASELPILTGLYKLLRGEEVFDQFSLPDYSIFPITLSEHDSSKRSFWANQYREIFILGVIYCLQNNQDAVKKWVSDCPSVWSAQTAAALLGVGLKIGETIKESRITYKNLIESLIDTEELKWPEDRDRLNLQHSLSDAIYKIMIDLYRVKKFLGDQIEVDKDFFELISDKQYLFSKFDLLKFALDSEDLVLSTDVYKAIRDENTQNLQETINTFPERTESYAQISKLVRLYEGPTVSKKYLFLAANNFLGYGYHKDSYLFDVIDAVKLCSETGLFETEVNDWINTLVPIIEHAKNYTDGDETGYLPETLAKLLATWNKGDFYKSLFFATRGERFYYAQTLFKILLNNFQYENNIETAIASTAHDKASFELLKKQSMSNDEAKKALGNIEGYLGEIDYPDDNSSGSSYTPSQDKVDYSKVDPSNMIEYLDNNFDNKWQMTTYLKEWTEYWIEHHDKEKIYGLNKGIIDKLGVSSISGELLDELFPLAHEFDNDFAFEILCQAQIRGYGWSKHWTDEKKAFRRWDLVEKYFPKRHMEFFRKSIGDGVPLSKGVEYLLRFGDSDIAKELTSASIEFATELMADLNLEDVDWHQSDEEVDLIELLLQRLLHPGTITQERVVAALVDLINSSSQGEQVFNRLTEWIKVQKMESTVAMGLLVIIKLLQTNSELSFVSVEKIKNCIIINSIVIEKLAEIISSLLKEDISDLPSFKSVEEPSQDYRIPNFFNKHIQTFLAPIYWQRATKIEQRTGFNFIRQWSYVADKIIEEAEIELDSNQVYFYGRSKDDEFLMAFSSKIGQVYRSAFLRVIQMVFNRNLIQEDFFLEHAYATLPIDLSHWKILPGNCPDWWPKLKDINRTEKQSNIESLIFDNPVENLKDLETDRYLLSAEGAIKPGANWQPKELLHSFSFMAFGYKTVGPDIPTAKEVAKKLFYAQAITRIPTKTNKPFNFLEDKENFFLIGDEDIRIKDLVVVPLVARERDLNIGLWQYYRDYEPCVNLTPALSENLTIEIDNNNWHYMNSDGEKIATYGDWLSGLRERYHRDLPIHHGQHLFIKKSYLDPLLRSKNLRLGFVAKKVFRVKEYTHDGVKEIVDFQLLNVSRLIIP